MGWGMSSKVNGDLPAEPMAAVQAAHELNNLFGAITGYAQFILDDAPAHSPQRAHAQRILAASADGAALAKRLALGAKQEH